MRVNIRKYEGKNEETIEKEMEALRQQDNAIARRIFVSLSTMCVTMLTIFMHRFSSFKDHLMT